MARVIMVLPFLRIRATVSARSGCRVVWVGPRVNSDDRRRFVWTPLSQALNAQGTLDAGLSRSAHLPGGDELMQRNNLSLFPRGGRLAFLGTIALTALVSFVAQVPAVQAQDSWVALSLPGRHALMRHALAPGTGDPDNFILSDCSTQRNLNEAGRAQAAAIGLSIRNAGIRVTRVLTSQWCRAAETARLMDVGPVVEEPSLNSFFGDRATEPEQTARVRKLLAEASSEKLILVTHQVNITALTGVAPASGEVLVIAISDDGRVEVVERIATDP
jgi:phosphohistidine phosphatase SixA